MNVICLAGVLVLGKWFCPVAAPAARNRRWEGWLQSLLSVFWKAGFIMCTFFCRRTSCQSTLHFHTLRPSVWVLTDSSWLEESQPSSSLGPGGFTPQVTFPCWPHCHLLPRHPETELSPSWNCNIRYLFFLRVQKSCTVYKYSLPDPARAFEDIAASSFLSQSSAKDYWPYRSKDGVSHTL